MAEGKQQPKLKEIRALGSEKIATRMDNGQISISWALLT